MIQPIELKLDLPMTVANGFFSTTTKVWDILVPVKTATWQPGHIPIKKILSDSAK